MADETKSDSAVLDGTSSSGDTGVSQTPATSTGNETYIDPATGALKPGWVDQYVPQDQRDRKVWATVTDLKSMTKTLATLDMVVGKQGKGIFPPTEKSTPTEVESFYKALGRPDKPEDYKFETPKGLEEYYDNPMVAEAKTELHKAGLTQAQMDVVMQLDARRLQASLDAASKADGVARDQAVAELKSKWGQDYDKRLLLANKMIAENVSEQDKPALLARVGNDPVVADFLASIAGKFVEAKLISVDDNTLGGRSIDSQITELESTPGFIDGSLKARNPKEHARIMSERDRLYQAKYPNREPA
jgi:hypothetical protein